MQQAIEEVMADIASRQEWHDEVQRGKMFGVLIAQAADGSRVVLKAYSGQILGRSDWEGYVPAIFDYLQPDGYFKQHETVITDINNKVRAKEALLPKGKRTAEVEALKTQRKELSNTLQRWLFSQFMLKGYDGAKSSVLDVFSEYAKANNLKQILPPGGTGECCAPKLLHYANSHDLTPLQLAEFWYGDSPKGEVRHHGQFYEPCQAKCQPILWYLMPKNGMQVLGTRIQAVKQVAPQLTPSDIIYEDEWFIAINKPAGLLSVPGKRQMPNAQDMLNELFYKTLSSNISSPLVGCSPPITGESEGVLRLLKVAEGRRGGYFLFVHRLDMDTSGVLLAAKTDEVFVAMQRLFASHEEVQKEYCAILSGDVADNIPSEGTISLPLSPDFLNRPRQIVDHENGKEAITRYKITARTVLLWPQTGRTHQLRIHCAYKDGLGVPILGDPLYGNTPSDRMYLHAQKLSFRHPITGAHITISCPANFPIT